MSDSEYWEIKPYVGIAGVQFGMSSERVRTILNSPVRSFLKTPSSKVPRDAFRELGIHIHYKTPEYCEAIELFPPANPTFQGKTLIGEHFNTLCDWLQSLDESLVINDTGLTSHRFGFGLYAPYIEENPDESVASVFVFERGYYDV